MIGRGDHAMRAGMNQLHPLNRTRSRSDLASALCTGADEAVIARVNQIGHALLVKRGSPAPLNENEDQLVFVARGATKLVAHVAVGREQILAFHFAGDLVWVPSRAVHTYSLCALTECELTPFRALRFFDNVKGDVAILAGLLNRSMQSLRQCRADAITLGRKSAQERVADFLVAMAERIGSPDGDSCVLNLPMSRKDIADGLSLTIETVSREISELRHAGLIETHGRSIVRLRDIEQLSRRAGQVPIAA